MTNRGPQFEIVEFTLSFSFDAKAVPPRFSPVSAPGWGYGSALARGWVRPWAT